MSTHDEPDRGRTSLVCPVCRELSWLKGPYRRFRCPNGHSYPVEELLALKERRLETLGGTLTALARLDRDLRSAISRVQSLPRRVRRSVQQGKYRRRSRGAGWLLKSSI